MSSSTADTEVLPPSPLPQASAKPSSALGMRSFGMTDQGAVRDSNEDQFLIATLSKSVVIDQSSLPDSLIQHPSEKGHVYLVADGFGGAPAGEQASAVAIKSIEDYLAHTLKWFFRMKGPETEKVLAEFQDALRQADARVFEEMSEHPEYSGMGTTLTLAYSLGSTLFVAHAGDSRCYLFRAPKLTQLTRDHTLAEFLTSQDVAPPDERTRRRLSHVVTNAIGGRTPGVRPEIHKHALKPGDVLLVATDGLTRGVPDQRIAEILGSQPDPRTACETLLSESLQAGGHDNATAIVARYGEL